MVQRLDDADRTATVLQALHNRIQPLNCVRDSRLFLCECRFAPLFKLRIAGRVRNVSEDSKRAHRDVMGIGQF